MEGQCPSTIWSKRFWTVVIYRQIEVRVQVDGCQSRMSQFADGRRWHARIPFEESRENSVAWEFERFFPACFLHYEFQAFPGESRERVARTDNQFLCLDSDHCSTHVTRIFSDNIFFFFYFFYFSFFKTILFYFSDDVVINGLLCI